MTLGGGAMQQRASDVLIPKLLGLFTSPHDGIRAMVGAAATLLTDTPSLDQSR